MSEQKCVEIKVTFSRILTNYKREQARLFEHLEQSPLFGVAR